jgi:hypothetical protein
MAAPGRGGHGAGRPGAPVSLRNYPGVSENDWTLQVESRSGLVSLEYFRSDADDQIDDDGDHLTQTGDQVLQFSSRLAGDGLQYFTHGHCHLPLCPAR